MPNSPQAAAGSAGRGAESEAGLAASRGLRAPAIGFLGLLFAALAVGIVAGFGAVLFRLMIGFVHNLLFLGKLSVFYDSSLFTPASPWGALVVLVPVIGALGVTFIVKNFAPEAKGHGVPEVMGAIYYRSGVIRPVVAVAKSLASALAIGTGAAVGREGPIVQIGASFGSTLGQILPMNRGQRITLVAAGAGAGIAATFNTPIGGVMFALELMLPEVSVNTFLPVALATGTATFIGRLFFGPQPAFAVPSVAPIPNLLPATGALNLVLYLVLGCLAGLAATGLIRGLHFLEDLFERIPQPYLRHMLGMLLFGLSLYGLERQFGHYFIEGVGYATIQAILTGQLVGVGLIALLCIGKITATSLSLGSGSSGGVFSPSLFIGATLGGAFAGFLAQLWPGAPVNLPAFAMVGMGAVVGGGTGAAMTAVTMIFEMTRDYAIVLPMILAVAASLGIRRLLSRETIYTMKLARRGQELPKALHTNMFLVRRARNVMNRDFLLLPAELTIGEIAEQYDARRALRPVVVTHGERIAAVAQIEIGTERSRSIFDKSARLGDVAHRDFILAREDAVMFDVIARLARRKAAAVLVVSRAIGRSHVPRPEDVRGIITKERVADEVADSLEVYPH